MFKDILIFIVVLLCFNFNIIISSYAQPITNPEDIIEQMKKHIEEMKIKNPKKYEEMVKGAGGKITDCLSCHIEVAEKSKSPTKGKKEGIPPIRK